MVGAGEQIRKGRPGKSRPYSELGKMLDALARSRDVRGPYNIAYYLKDVAGYEVSGQAVLSTYTGSPGPSTHL